MTTLAEKIASFMSETPGKEYSLAEITEALKKRHAEEFSNKPTAQLNAEIASRFSRLSKEGRYPQIIEVEGVKPKKRYWSNDASTKPPISGDSKAITKPRPKKSKQEHDLYAPLIEFLFEERGVRAFRIDELKSSNRSGAGANWQRHPDIVGVEGMIGNKGWTSHVRQLASETSQIDNARVWSFEVKNKIANVGELRKHYNQAISNSSWANLGYLCVEEIATSDRMEEEIKLLTGAHGIGIIVINKKKPLESSIHTEADETDSIDLDFCNVLAVENPDFAEFIDYATNVYKTGKVY